MKIEYLNGVEVYKFHNLLPFPEIEHFIHTRHGGVSVFPYSTLNTAFHVGDNEVDVMQNRNKLAESMGLDLLQFTFASQTHSNNIYVVTESQKSSGCQNIKTALADTDGMLCNIPSIMICVQVADCVPILLFDPVKRVIGAIHAGWRGTIKLITLKAISLMTKLFECHPADILAGIGPAIGPCCYEVGYEVKDASVATFGSTKNFIRPSGNTDKFIFDLWAANNELLLLGGLSPKNIEISKICTLCNSEVFFSSRSCVGPTGRFMGGIMIR